ncbi:AI-2E family transporter [Lachnobacterium bovis]|uniref:AI-2E family transporter n=1 Tax=Lachnobacterium bovis TaxID=140626 RepID=UPI0003B34905|nr:AI-2E family transporter [Lachnobacterium bovis]
MKFNKNWLEKKWVAYTIAICSGVILYEILNNLSIFAKAIAILYNFVYPVVIGIIIAYILDPMVMLLQEKVFRGIQSKKISRGISIFVTILSLIVFLGIIMIDLIPQLVASIAGFAKQSKNYAGTFEKMVDEVNGILKAYNINGSNFVSVGSNMLNKIGNMISGNVTNIINTSFSIGKGLANAVIAFILAIYFLIDKDNMIKGVKRLLRILVDQKTYNNLAVFWRKCNHILIKYIACDLLDGLIIGIINFIFMTILGMPYPLLISFIVGVTNLAPTFGPIVGGAIGGSILVLSSPISALWFIVFTIVLQTLDGYVIKPKLFGDSLGVSSIWILIAIIVGGRMFGVVGIMIAIPVAAIIDYIYKEYFLYRMEEKKNIEHQAFDTYKDKSIALLKDIKDIKEKKIEKASKHEEASSKKGSSKRVTSKHDKNQKETNYTNNKENDNIENGNKENDNIENDNIENGNKNK